MAVKSNLSLNINKDDSNINDFLYVWDYFKSRPNKITLHKTYVSNQFEEILKEYQKEINKFSEIIPSDEENIVNDKIIMTLCVDLETFEMYYSASTIKKLNKLIKKVKKNDKGISIIYGERGTGKTSAISQIANKLDRIVIFIPNNMIEHTINNPDFRKFLKRYSKPIIVIDDCEMIFNDYLTKSNMVVNNLLQLSDGFLSETIDVTFIAIFNVEDENEIDRNLIECNNLIDIIDFEFLNSDEANELSIHLGEKAKYKNKTKLVDIIKKNTLQNNKKIGF